MAAKKGEAINTVVMKAQEVWAWKTTCNAVFLCFPFTSPLIPIGCADGEKPQTLLDRGIGLTGRELASITVASPQIYTRCLVKVKVVTVPVKGCIPLPQR